MSATNQIVAGCLQVVHALLRQTFQAKPPSPSGDNPLLDLLGQLLQPAADLEVAEVVRLCTESRPLLTSWFLAHMFDLLSCYGRDAAILQASVAQERAT